MYRFMTTILVGMNNSVLLIESTKSGWKIHKSLVGTHPQGIAFDHLNSNRAYCGTFGEGLWSTDDCGQSWNRLGKGSISNQNMTSVSVSRLEKGSEGFNVVYAGTEPSEFYRSEDGGHSWQRMIGLNGLQSSQFWSFPPRPWTHHVRWIEADVNTLGHLFVAIEAGALVQSHDGGRTWIDRRKQGPFDTHTLATHRKAPKRIYSSAGDGYFESFDDGETWSTPIDGLNHHYLYGLAVDANNPQNLVVSASAGPWQAHSVGQDAESFVYRKSDGDQLWELVSKGLPEPQGTMIAILAADPKNAGVFYLASNRGLFCSTDLGLSWNAVDLSWPSEYLLQHAWSLAIQEQ
jgi:photosystem II stability/assembly factor-like uncharacterized protein